MSHPARPSRSSLGAVLVLATFLIASFLLPTAGARPAAAATAGAAEVLVSVKAHGARGDGATDDTAAVRAAFAAAVAQGATGVHFPAGTYKLTRAIDVPDAVRVIDLADGAVVRQHADDSAFEKVGSVRAPQYAVSEARAGSTSVVLGSTSGLAVGDWFYFGSDDLLHGGKGYRRGFLRRIVAISGNRATLDRPLHRSLATSPRGWEVVLAPSVQIRGGVIEQHDPRTKRHAILLFELVRSPQVVGTEIRNCGGSGIKTLGTAGGRLDAHIHDCLDDASGTRFGSGSHYGYGVETTGATRGLRVHGTSTRTRHAFTTNGAYGPHSDKRLLLIGEPEDVTVSMDVWGTTSSGFDTHEVGWNIAFRDCSVRDAGAYRRAGSTDGKEGGFGIFIRARGTVVERCVVHRSAQDGITVAVPPSGMSPWRPAAGPVIRDTKVTATQGTRGVHLHQPAHLTRVIVDGSHEVGIQMAASGAGSTATDTVIDLRGHPSSIGVLHQQHLARANVVVRNASRSFV